MRRGWIPVDRIGLVIIFIISLAGVQSQSARVYGSEQEVQARLRKVRQSFKKQREMFRNMRFKADWLDPHMQIKQEPGKPPDQIDFIEIPDDSEHTGISNRY